MTNMPTALVEYFAALERLTKGVPVVVPKGAKITNDSVALEAGRGKGSIKKSRPVFSELIEAIAAAAATQIQPANVEKDKLKTAREEAKRYRQLWEEALCREASLVKQLWDERQDWASKEAALTGERVASIHARRRHSLG